MRRCLLLLLSTACLLAESAAGLKWTAPPEWKNEGERPMRAATYQVPDGGECAVYFFGAGQGGSVEANVARWKGQLTRAGKPAEAQVRKTTVHGLPVTMLDISGDYSGMGGPMAQQKSVLPNYRLLGAIVEGPQGNIFVKFTAPAKTITANQKKFEAMVATFQKP